MLSLFTRIRHGQEILVHEGDEYRWLECVSCRDGSVQHSGTILKVIKQTLLTPHDEVGPHGHNWLCDASNGRTVWATLESCIARGLLKKIEA